KSAHNESYPLVLGKVELSIPQLKGASFLIEQQLYDAVTTARFQKDDWTVVYKTFVSATDDVMAVEISMTGKGSLEGDIRLALPGEKEILNKPPVELAHPGKRELSVTAKGIQYLSRAFEDSVEIPTKAAIALQVAGSPDGKFTLKQGKPVRFVCAFSSNFKSKDCVEAVIRKVTECTPKRVSAIEKAHKQWWKNY
ncbi:hypothetical protein EZS27_042937, partial [termite gut metagenome]